MSKEKRGEMLQDALHYLDDEMIEEVEALRGFKEKEECKLVKKNPWKKWLAMAASVCLLFVGSWIYEAYIQPVNHSEKIPEMNAEDIVENKTDDMIEDEQENNQEEDSIRDLADIPDFSNEESAKEDLLGAISTESLEYTDDIEADMLGFFILNGYSYIQYEFQWDYKERSADFVGDYVGYITGSIDEWTQMEDYADGMGTYTGNVYEIKGVSPEFMLCMVWEDGGVETFINHDYHAFDKGTDLVDDCMNLRDNYKTIALETTRDNKFGYAHLELTEEELEVFDQFLDAFAEGDYSYVESIVENPFGGDKDTSDMLDFYFVKENGVLLRFRTMGDGYVMFPWIDACVKIDQDIYKEVVDILLQHIE